jgi:hypothetical protein
MSTMLSLPMTRAWLALIAATLAVFALVENDAPARGATVAIILIAAFKVRLVFLHFMELSRRRHAVAAGGRSVGGGGHPDHPRRLPVRDPVGANSFAQWIRTQAEVSLHVPMKSRLRVYLVHRNGRDEVA